MRRSQPGVRSPQLLTPEVHEQIVRLLRLGNYFETASKACGIQPAVSRTWLTEGKALEARGQDLESPVVRFAVDVSLAMAGYETDAIAMLTKAGIKDWKALAWKLERMFPRKFGQRVRTEVANAIHAFLDAIKESESREVYLRVCRIAAEFETGAVDEAVPEDAPEAVLDGELH